MDELAMMEALLAGPHKKRKPSSDIEEIDSDAVFPKLTPPEKVMYDPKSPGYSEENPQRQAEVVITPLPAEKIIFDQGNYIRSNPAQFARENLNEKLGFQLNELEGMRQKPKMLDAALAKIAGEKQRVLEGMTAAPEAYPVNQGLEDQIKAARQGFEDAEMPEESMISKAIRYLGPGLLGGLSGQTGAASAAPTFKQVQDMSLQEKKDALEKFKIKQEQVKKDYQSLLDLREKDRSAWTKEQEFALKKTELQLKTLQDAAKGTTDEKIATIKAAMEAEAQFGKDVQSGIGKVADLQQRADEMDARLEAARINAANAAKKMNKPTEFQAKAAMNSNLMAHAEDVLTPLYQGGVLPSSRLKFFKTMKEIDLGKFGATPVSEYLSNQIRKSYSPEEYEKIKDQAMAESAFLEAIGRIKSGAAISMAEWLNFRRPYFDDYGENPRQSAMKKKLRESERNQFALLAGEAPVDYNVRPEGRLGTATGKTPKAAPAPEAVPKSFKAGEEMTHSDGRIFVRGKDGKWRPKK